MITALLRFTFESLLSNSYTPLDAPISLGMLRTCHFIVNRLFDNPRACPDERAMSADNQKRSEGRWECTAPAVQR